MDTPSIGGAAALRPLWLSDLKAQGEAAVRWLWQGYLAAGSLTLLTSQWKAGKTTLLALLLDRMKRGGELAGAAVRKGKAVIVSEEPASLWLQRSQRFNFGKHVCWLCRPFPRRPSASEWSALIEQLLGPHEQLGLSLVAIDPLAGFLPVRSENDAAEMLAALLPLQRLTSAGLSVLVLHHPRKQARADGQAARGSGALSGHADILLEMHWVAAAEEDRRRRLLAWSRHEETPRRRTIELSADGRDYAVVAEVEDDPQQPVREALWRVLEESPIKLTQAEMLENWPEGERRPAAVTLWRLLDRCVESGELKRDAGGRGTTRIATGCRSWSSVGERTRGRGRGSRSRRCSAACAWACHRPCWSELGGVGHFARPEERILYLEPPSRRSFGRGQHPAAAHDVFQHRLANGSADRHGSGAVVAPTEPPHRAQVFPRLESSSHPGERGRCHATIRLSG